MGGLPDTCTQGLRATGPRAEGVYIRQATSAHGITITYITLTPQIKGFDCGLSKYCTVSLVWLSMSGKSRVV